VAVFGCGATPTLAAVEAALAGRAPTTALIDERLARPRARSTRTPISTQRRNTAAGGAHLDGPSAERCRRPGGAVIARRR